MTILHLLNVPILSSASSTSIFSSDYPSYCSLFRHRDRSSVCEMNPVFSYLSEPATKGNNEIQAAHIKKGRQCKRLIPLPGQSPFRLRLRKNHYKHFYYAAYVII